VGEVGYRIDIVPLAEAGGMVGTVHTEDAALGTQAAEQEVTAESGTSDVAAVPRDVTEYDKKSVVVAVDRKWRGMMTMEVVEGAEA